MALKAANFNLKTDWLTTVTGVITLVIPILALIGLISQDQASGLQANLGTIATSISGIIGAVSAIILMFSGKTA
jgi:hypothetical protein